MLLYYRILPFLIIIIVTENPPVEKPTEEESEEKKEAPINPIDLDKKVFVSQKRALLFLPTRFHVMLKFMIYEDHTLVKIRTDFWQILSYLDAFFSVTLSV